MAMQSLYEKDKVFAIQHLVSKEGSKISYRDTLEEARRAQLNCGQSTHIGFNCNMSKTNIQQSVTSECSKQAAF